MVVKRQCSFCAREIEPGTGTMFVKRDGTVFHFCSSSCRKQQLNLGRVGHRFKWTRAHELKRAADHSTAQKVPAPAPSVKPSARRPARPLDQHGQPPLDVRIEVDVFHRRAPHWVKWSPQYDRNRLGHKR